MEDLHRNLDKFVTKFVLTEGGGHCAVNREKQTVEEIRAWNKAMVIKDDLDLWKDRLFSINFCAFAHGWEEFSACHDADSS